MNRVVVLRVASCGILGLGAALLMAALLLSTYTADRLGKVPLDIDTTLVSVGSGTALDPATLTGGVPFVVKDYKRVVSQQQITVEAPANADVVTLQSGTVVRTDRSQDKDDKRATDNSLLLGIVDTVKLNRTTAMAVPGGFVQRPRWIGDDDPPTPVLLNHTGLSYRFPFHTEKETYEYFDPIAQQAFDADFDGEADVDGLTVYRFTQRIGYDEDGQLDQPIKYPSVWEDGAGTTVTAPAYVWGLPGNPDAKLTLTRYYAAQRTLWVDPVSGTIVREELHANHFFSRDPAREEVTLADYTVKTDQQSTESQVDAARDERDRLALWSRVLPITFTAAGVISLVGGALVGLFALRTEAALIDPSLDAADHGFFDSFFAGFGRTHEPGEKVSGAEAETEQIPIQHPLRAKPDTGEPDTAEPEPPERPDRE